MIFDTTVEEESLSDHIPQGNQTTYNQTYEVDYDYLDIEIRMEIFVKYVNRVFVKTANNT